MNTHQNMWSRFVAIGVIGLVCALSGCRGMQIRHLDERIDQLETRVAVLESQAAGQSGR